MDGVSNQSLKSLTKKGTVRLVFDIHHITTSYFRKGINGNIKKHESIMVKFISVGVGLRC
jgi:hypothetical protein